jgi:hypothetical protein
MGHLVAERAEGNLKLGEIDREHDPIAADAAIKTKPVDRPADGTDAYAVKSRDLWGRVALWRRGQQVDLLSRGTLPPSLQYSKPTKKKLRVDPDLLEVKWDLLRASLSAQINGKI